MLLPSPLQDARLIGLFDELKKFEMVSKGLQKADSNLYDARYALNFVADKYPSTESKLGPNFTDYLWRPFESAIVKVQSNKEPNLSVEERTSLEAFLVDPLIGEVAQAEVGKVDSYEALVKRARQEIPVIVMTKYIKGSPSAVQAREFRICRHSLQGYVDNSFAAKHTLFQLQGRIDQVAAFVALLTLTDLTKVQPHTESNFRTLN